MSNRDLDMPVSCEMKPYATCDQIKPNGAGVSITSLVMHDLIERTEKGINTYGQALRANNGRSALVDAYQEALDLAMYLRQAIEEMNHGS